MVEQKEIPKKCPYGHKNIDFVDLGDRKYVYCYSCKKKYSLGDYLEFPRIMLCDICNKPFESQSKFDKWCLSCHNKSIQTVKI